MTTATHPDETSKQTVGAAAIIGARWRIIASLSLQVSTLISTLVLVRLLAPEDFAIIAGATIVLNFLSVMADLGLGQSLIQDREPTAADYSTYAWFGMVLGAALAVLGIATAPMVADALGIGGLEPYLRVMLLTLPFSMTLPVPRAQLIRQLRFKAVSIIEIAGSATYITLAVTLAALLDLGAWSIVVGRLGQSITQTVAASVVAGWKPSLHFSVSLLRRRAGYNSGVFLGTSINYFAKNADYWVVARYLAPEALGYYYVAFVVPNLVRQRVTASVHHVTFAVAAKMQNETARLLLAYREALRLVLCVVAPLLVGLAVLNELFISVVFGRKWVTAAEPLTWIALAALVAAIFPVGHAVFLARGRVRIPVIDRTIALVAFIMLIPWYVQGGLRSVGLGLLASSIPALIFHLWALHREIGLSVYNIYSDHRMTVAATTVMAATIYVSSGLTTIGSMSPMLRLLVLTALGAIIYGATATLIDRRGFARLLRRLLSVLAPRLMPKRWNVRTTRVAP